MTHPTIHTTPNVSPVPRQGISHHVIDPGDVTGNDGEVELSGGEGDDAEELEESGGAGPLAVDDVDASSIVN